MIMQVIPINIRESRRKHVLFSKCPVFPVFGSAFGTKRVEELSVCKDNSQGF